MEVSKLTSKILDDLEAFDQRHKRLGLYTMNRGFTTRHSDYNGETLDMVIEPTLNDLGCAVQKNEGHTASVFVTPDGTIGKLEMRRVSLIKVRQHGGTYRVDRNIEAKRQWNKSRFSHQIRRFISSGIEQSEAKI